MQLARRPGISAELVERASPSALGLVAQRALHYWTHLSPDFSNLRGLSRAMLDSFDIIVSVHEPALLTLALRKAGREDGAALVPIFIGGEKRRERSRLPFVTCRLLRLLFDRSVAVVVVGEGEREYLLQERLVEPERVHVVPFGVDESFWTPGERPLAANDCVLAVGNDDARDYATLLRAIGSHPLRLHTRLAIDGRLLGPNVRLTRGDWHAQALSDAQLRDLYRDARFVVTPLRETAQPSGQSVTLQAMACGKAVILSRTRGLWSPALMRHMENCLLVPPGDVASLREAIERLVADAGLLRRIGAAARQTVERHFTSSAMADGLARVLDSAMTSR